MARSLWKGAISFGLLNAPVALHAATQQDEIDFDWLQKGTLEPVGYKRVVKTSGKEVDKDDVVKAVKQHGEYVVLSDEEIATANVKSTHSVDIVSFTDAKSLPFLFFETPYFLSPAKGGEKVYALLREALLKSGKIGIALLVLHNKQHLAALIPTERAIVLNTLRWSTEVKTPDGLELPEAGVKANDIKPKELEMATQLIESMSEDWHPEQYKDTFRDDIMALVEKKLREGHAREIAEVKREEPADIPSEIDLTELLKQSLQGQGASKPIIPRQRPPVHASRAPRNRAGKTAH